MIRTSTLRRSLGWLMAAVLALSILVWLLTRDTLPGTIRIATAERGGLYYSLGQGMAEELERETGRRVEVLATAGSAANRALLLAGDAELAIVQSGSVDRSALAVLAPLYDDVVHLIARRDGAVESLLDLPGRRVALGLPGSGMRPVALELLERYRVSPGELEGDESYFMALLDDPSYDAAIVTTGLLNPDLETLLGSGEYRVLPIRDAAAFSIRHPFFHPFVLPRGFYREAPPVPAEATPTLATTSILVARAGASHRLVERALAALYEGDLRARVPILATRSEAAAWERTPLHPAARRYFDPFAGVDLLAAFMESLAAIKELIFALAAALYLGWDRWRRVKEREREAELVEMKERLDQLLDETASIERAQIGVHDRRQLIEYLRQVTRIKLRALEELTGEDLRGDRMFLIFLIQCADLSEKLQHKIIHGLAAADAPGS